MKHLIILIVFFLSKIIFASTEFEIVYLLDTIASPPEFPIAISGELNPCVGDTAVYTADIPVSCIANWYIDGELQSSTTNTLEIIWTEGGSFIISLDFECDTNIYPAGSLLINVNDVPNNPSPITGETEVCRLSTEIYTTEVGEGELCQWIVDGIIQLSDTTFLSYYWAELGTHNIEVRAANDCGISEAEYLDVYVVELPVVNLGNDTTILQGQSVELDAGNPGCTYLWSTSETTQAITISQSGDYDVVVTNACGDVMDDITVDVVVGINQHKKAKELTIVVAGDYLSVNIQDASIEKVQIWDISGRLILDSMTKPIYYLPQNGIFIVKVFTENGDKYSCRFIKEQHKF